MYKVTIVDAAGEILVEMKTEQRVLARDTFLLCKENQVTCEVVRETEPKPVVFKGMD